MAMPAKDLTGQRFGYLTVVRRAGTNASKCATWVCRCDCGKDNVLLDTPRGRMTTAQAAREFGLKPVTLYARLNRYGWPLEKTLLTPSTTSSTADHGVAS